MAKWYHDELSNHAPVYVTNTPRAGESAEQTRARTREGRDAGAATNPKDAVGVRKVGLSVLPIRVRMRSRSACLRAR
jgi:O-acetylhomoserine/O-acetylserine sulfhydrylase-like pyridoxal-dependent enzyme